MTGYQREEVVGYLVAGIWGEFFFFQDKASSWIGVNSSTLFKHGKCWNLWRIRFLKDPGEKAGDLWSFESQGKNCRFLNRLELNQIKKRLGFTFLQDDSFYVPVTWSLSHPVALGSRQLLLGAEKPSGLERSLQDGCRVHRRHSEPTEVRQTPASERFGRGGCLPGKGVFRRRVVKCCKGLFLFEFWAPLIFFEICTCTATTPNKIWLVSLHIMMQYIIMNLSTVSNDKPPSLWSHHCLSMVFFKEHRVLPRPGAANRRTLHEPYQFARATSGTRAAFQGGAGAQLWFLQKLFVSAQNKRTQEIQAVPSHTGWQRDTRQKRSLLETNPP